MIVQTILSVSYFGNTNPDVCKVIHYAGHIWSRQLCWDDLEIGTTISCTKCCQVAWPYHSFNQILTYKIM